VVGAASAATSESSPPRAGDFGVRHLGAALESWRKAFQCCFDGSSALRERGTSGFLKRCRGTTLQESAIAAEVAPAEHPHLNPPPEGEEVIGYQRLIGNPAERILPNRR